MDPLHKHAELILHDSVKLLYDVRHDKADKSELEDLLREIVRLSHTLLQDEQEAMQRIRGDLKDLFGSEETLKEHLEALGVDVTHLLDDHSSA